MIGEEISLLSYSTLCGDFFNKSLERVEIGNIIKLKNEVTSKLLTPMFIEDRELRE
jgi:hypothetical protein